MKDVDTLLMRKVGGFYQAFDEDAYILSFLFGYKIKNGKLGFPVNVMDRVKLVLEEHKINYTFKISDEEEEHFNFKQDNCYFQYLEKGEEYYQKEKLIERIIEKAQQLTKKQIQEIYSYVNTFSIDNNMDKD